MVGLIFKLVVRNLLLLSRFPMDKDILYTKLKLSTRAIIFSCSYKFTANNCERNSKLIFFSFIFLNTDISVSILDLQMKLKKYVNNVLLEGSVSLPFFI